MVLIFLRCDATKVSGQALCLNESLQEKFQDRHYAYRYFPAEKRISGTSLSDLGGIYCGGRKTGRAFDIVAPVLADKL